MHNKQSNKYFLFPDKIYFGNSKIGNLLKTVFSKEVGNVWI